VRVHPEHQQVGRAGETHDLRAVWSGEVEEDVVDGVDHVPVHVVAHDMTPPGDDGDGRAVVPGARRPGGQRAGVSGGLVRGEFLATVEDEQAAERQACTLGHPFQLLDVPGQPAACRLAVRERLALRLGERETPPRHGREVLAEELHGRVDLLARSLPYRPSELPVGASRLDVDEGDPHGGRPGLEAENATGVGVVREAELGGTPVDEVDEFVQDVPGQADRLAIAEIGDPVRREVDEPLAP
jgi:hypothetical protein